MMMRSHVLVLSAVVSCTFALAAGTARDAHAQEATTTGAAAALFDEGVSLMEKGSYAEACPKLARSNGLYRGSKKKPSNTDLVTA